MPWLFVFIIISTELECLYDNSKFDYFDLYVIFITR